MRPGEVREHAADRPALPEGALGCQRPLARRERAGVVTPLPIQRHEVPERLRGGAQVPAPLERGHRGLEVAARGVQVPEQELHGTEARAGGRERQVVRHPAEHGHGARQRRTRLLRLPPRAMDHREGDRGPGDQRAVADLLADRQRRLDVGLPAGRVALRESDEPEFRPRPRRLPALADRVEGGERALRRLGGAGEVPRAQAQPREVLEVVGDTGAVPGGLVRRHRALDALDRLRQVPPRIEGRGEHVQRERRPGEVPGRLALPHLPLGLLPEPRPAVGRRPDGQEGRASEPRPVVVPAPRRDRQRPLHRRLRLRLVPQEHPGEPREQQSCRDGRGRPALPVEVGLALREVEGSPVVLP